MHILLIGYGYIGSFLKPLLDAAGYTVIVCDQNGRNLIGVTNGIQCRYQELTINDLTVFDTILWFAGHSSVSMAVDDPHGAIANNCFDLLQLAKRKRVPTPLIYASTGSLYSIEEIGYNIVPPSLSETETRLNPINPYDSSKVAFDALASFCAPGLTGLRLGTVSGYSPNMRGELIFNAMNLMALREGRVRVSNRHAHRNILFLNDLAHYVLTLISLPQVLPQILNVGSHNLTTGELANEIANFHGVPIEEGQDTKTYSFRMDCRRARELCGSLPEISISERCATFALEVNGGR